MSTSILWLKRQFHRYCQNSTLIPYMSARRMWKPSTTTWKVLSLVWVLSLPFAKIPSIFKTLSRTDLRKERDCWRAIRLLPLTTNHSWEKWLPTKKRNIAWKVLKIRRWRLAWLDTDKKTYNNLPSLVARFRKRALRLPIWLTIRRGIFASRISVRQPIPNCLYLLPNFHKRVSRTLSSTWETTREDTCNLPCKWQTNSYLRTSWLFIRREGNLLAKTIEVTVMVVIKRFRSSYWLMRVRLLRLKSLPVPCKTTTGQQLSVVVHSEKD